MEVLNLTLTDFRNYEHAEVSFQPGLNLVVGKNGQGKTNLLEAVHILSALGSHRVNGVLPLVRVGAERAVLRSETQVKNRRIPIDCEIKASGGIRMLVNKVPLERGYRSDPAMSSVLFSPEDLALTKGGPEERRRYLDQAATRIRSLAAAARQDFERVLKQRNGVLKAALSNPRALRQLDVWTDQLITTSIEVVKNRLKVLTELTPFAQLRYRQVALGSDGPTLRYEASWAEGEQLSTDSITPMLREAIERSATKDLERGITLVGPHRDDVQIELDGSDCRTYASQGEQRSIALSLRLAERDLIAETKGEDPILLLDDVFSELDDSRKAQLAELVVSAGQTIATATSAENLPLGTGRTISVEAGKLLDG